MSPEAWGVNIGAIVVGGVAALEAIRSRLAAGKARDSAEEAADLSRPTGNGFAKRIDGKLDEVLRRLDTVEGKIDRHLEGHATADLNRGTH